ncbi:sarcosine oxidase subunit gamma family protein [Candidatus Thioglobus sp.]|nr:sarcosine oxidase subunit gamma family protein [Candidatus Thioglobus sp.]
MILKEDVYVSDYELLPESPLGGVEIELDGFNITEVTDKSLVMVALPREKFKDVESSIDKSCGLKLPEMECSTESKDSSITLWRLQKNQVLAYFTYEGNDAESHLSSRLSVPAYYTDQSDTWAMIRVSGNRSREVLERICPIDLSPEVFSVGSVSRTIMEHIGTIIFRDGDDSYVLLTMRSFGRSMLHAIEVSAENVL